MNLEDKIEELSELSAKLAEQYARQNEAIARYFAAIRRIAEIAGIEIEDVIDHRNAIDVMIARLRARGVPELNAAANILELFRRARKL